MKASSIRLTKNNINEVLESFCGDNSETLIESSTYETNMTKIRKYIDENKEEFLGKLKSAKETRNKN